MNRFGWIFLLALVALAGGFSLLIRPGGERLAPPESSSSAPAARNAERLPSGLVLPVIGVQPAQLSDTFGDPRGSGTRGHGALDIMAPRGTPVVASLGGTVEKIFESEAGGHTVYIREPRGGWLFYYAHLDAYAPGLREGQQVTQGQQIGTVGSTGNASPEGPHLHFEIRLMAPGETWHQGRAINPYTLLAGR